MLFIPLQLNCAVCLYFPSVVSKTLRFCGNHNLPIVSLFCLTYSTANSSTHEKMFPLLTIFYTLLYLSDLQERESHRKYSCEIFVSTINQTKICDTLSHCKQSNSLYVYTSESSLAKHFVILVWICC